MSYFIALEWIYRCPVLPLLVRVTAGLALLNTAPDNYWSVPVTGSEGT